jgi:translocation and assembly module TamB
MLLVAGIGAWALYTDSGARSVLAMARGWLPPGMTIGEVRGRVGGTLYVTDFHYRDPAIGMDLRVESAALEVSPFALLANRLHVGRASVEGVVVEFFPATAPPAPAPPIERNPWRAPLGMRFDDVQLLRGQWRRPGAAPVLFTRAAIAGSWIGTEIEATKLVIEGPDGAVNLTARLGSRAPILRHLQASFRWQAGEHQWEGKLGASSAREALEIDAALDLPVKVHFGGRVEPAPARDGKKAWLAHLAVDRFDPHPLITTEAFDSVALVLDAEGNPGDLALQGELALGQDVIHLERLVLARREQLLQVTALRARLNSQPAALTGTATLALDGSRPASAHLAWDEFALPDAWAGANFRCAGDVALTGSRERFAANSRVRLSRAERHSTLAIRLDGSQDSLNITELELTQNPGLLSVSGEVTLAQPVHWRLAARARAFDPSLFLADWPGALDFDLNSSGEWPEAGPDASFKLENLKGRLRKRALTGSGDVTLARDLRPRGRLSLRSGRATFDAVASQSPRPRVDARLRVAALEEWSTALRGALNVDLTSLGRWPEVDVHATAQATGVRSGETAFKSAKLILDARDAKAPSGKLTLDTQGVELAGFSFDDARVALDGNESAHRLQLDANGEALKLALEASGTTDRRSWNGLIESLRLEAPKVPPLSLEKPARLAVSADSMSLENACLRGGDSTLCLAGTRTRQEFAVNYSLQALPLAMLATLAAPDSTLLVDGMLEGSGDLRRAPDGTFSGQATLTSPTGAVAQGEEDDALRLAYRDFSLDANLSRETGLARLHGTLVDQGDLDGTLSIAVRERDPTLAGKASVELRDLGPLAWFMPQLAQMRGRGALSAEVSGTLGQPRFAVTVTARDMDAEVPLLGLHLTEGNVSVKLGSDGALDADGSITSGDGKLTLSGTRDDASGLAVRIGGGNFLAANIPGARVTIAPDLSLSGRFDALLLTGTVTIEEADVNLEKLKIGGSAQTSGDVVVVDREQHVKARTEYLTTDVRILFGKNVKLAGYGLESTVAGELRVTEKPNEVSRAVGEILVAGTYEAFGRKLTIERGRLQYAGTALDDPQLDILAVRKVEDVTAKLRVTGTAQKPKLDVFTDPAMSQTDAMAYLITGKKASELHGEDGAMVSSAAQSVGSVLGNRLAKKLGGKMGFVDEVGVEQNTDLGGSAFTVGKYLSPRLFVSYGVGLFEPGNAITVRWQFTERWSLEANDTPDEQHAGIRYRIEK